MRCRLRHQDQRRDLDALADEPLQVAVDVTGTRKPELPKPLLISVVVVEIGSAVLAWRDLVRRADDQVSG
jgi:hypothetical protein